MFGMNQDVGVVSERLDHPETLVGALGRDLDVAGSREAGAQVPRDERSGHGAVLVLRAEIVITDTWG